MSYKVSVTTPIQTYSIVFGKRNLDYYLSISGKTSNDYFGTKERLLHTYTNFMTGIGMKDAIKDYFTHYETINPKNFTLTKVFVEE